MINVVTGLHERASEAQCQFQECSPQARYQTSTLPEQDLQRPVRRAIS